MEQERDDRLVCVGFLDAKHVHPLFVERFPIGGDATIEERHARVTNAWQIARRVVLAEPARLRVESLDVMARALNLGVLPEDLPEVVRMLGEAVGADARTLDDVVEDVRAGICAYVAAKTSHGSPFDAEVAKPGQRPTRARAEVWQMS